MVVVVGYMVNSLRVGLNPLITALNVESSYTFSSSGNITSIVSSSVGDGRYTVSFLVTLFSLTGRGAVTVIVSVIVIVSLRIGVLSTL